MFIGWKEIQTEPCDHESHHRENHWHPQTISGQLQIERRQNQPGKLCGEEKIFRNNLGSCRQWASQIGSRSILNTGTSENRWCQPSSKSTDAEKYRNPMTDKLKFDDLGIPSIFLADPLELTDPSLKSHGLNAEGFQCGFNPTAMSIILSPVRSQELDAMATDASPMITNMTPLEEPEDEGRMKELDSIQRYEKPPPLHTGADWKVVLHLPEIETWLRMTSERVRDLTYSVQQDAENRHVDVHLVQLKDICEDISDHVELIHALLETEISLKLLSYSVNILVDIHTVQLLWHQLRVSVLVLRERILQGLQDSNGNYTRQTDILQAFSEDRKETCLDSLTEVDDAGQLTIKCSQDYFSLDCGITAFELSDYSPSEDVPYDAEATMTSSSATRAKPKPFGHCNSADLERGFPELVRSVGLLSVANDRSTSRQEEIKASDESQLSLADHQTSANSKTSPKSTNHPALSQTPPAECTRTQNGIGKSSKQKVFSDTKIDDLEAKRFGQVHSCSAKSNHRENSTPKRPIKDCFNYNEESPTQPSLPKRALYLDEISKDDLEVSCCRISTSVLSHKVEMSRSTPSLFDHPDRSRLWLDLASSYPSTTNVAVSHSYDELNKTGNANNGYLSSPSQCNLQKTTLGLNKTYAQHQRKSLAINKSCDLHDLRQSNSVSTRSPTQHYREPLARSISSPVQKLQNDVSLSSSQTSPDTTFTIKSLHPCCPPNTKTPSGENYNNSSDSFNSHVLTDQCKDSNEQIIMSPACQNLESGHEYKKKSPDRQGSHKAAPLHTPHNLAMADSPGFIPTVSLLQQQQRTENSSSRHQTTENDKSDIWFGSNEYLALPSHLKETEVLALKLENLTKLLSHSPTGEALQNIDDWELSEANSVTEVNPSIYNGRKSRKWLLETGTISPTSSSDIAPSLDDSIESGPLSDILSDDESSIPETASKHNTIPQFPRHWVTQIPKNALDSATPKSTLVQQLQEDIQQKQNNRDVWEKIEGFVNKLDELIRWLFEAMETTENWTPPKADTNSLKLYLETHLSFKLNVDSHCALKDAVVEEGQHLLELIQSHKSGLKDMLQIIASQWQELQRQIKRQHSWILRALDIIKAEILATDVTADGLEGPGSPKEEIQLIKLETRRDAVEQMSLKLYSEQYTNTNKRKQEFAAMSKVNRVDTYSLLDFESEYTELWDWLIDMESIVMDSHDLMMSEEQQQHLYKGYSMEMSMWLPKKLYLLKKVESLRQAGSSLPCNVLEKVEGIKDKWHLLEKTLGEKTRNTVVGPSGVGTCDLLSPESSSLVRQLEVRIKELKGWMRDTELFIFNSCLLQGKEGTMEAQKKLQYFKSLCTEIKQRRRGIISVLRLCQRLLDGTDASCLEADHQSMQLIIVNLERRWEAIIMQAVQWQNRLQKQLGKEKVSLSCIEPGLMDLNVLGEDSLEWDETDMSNNLIGIRNETPDLACEQNDISKFSPGPVENLADELMQDQYTSGPGESLYSPGEAPSSSCPRSYQVYSLHNVQLHGRDQMSFFKNVSNFSNSKHPTNLVRRASKDSSFSSNDSLPDLLGDLIPVKEDKPTSLKHVSESGIVSEGDKETTTNSETSLPNQVDQAQTKLSVKALHPLIELKHKDCPIQSCICKGQRSLEKKEVKNAARIQTTKYEVELSKNLQSLSLSNEGNLQPLDMNKIASKGFSNDLEAQYDVFTFYDYSYLQGPELELSMTITHSPEEKETTDGNVSSKPHSAEFICKNGLSAPESKPDCATSEKCPPITPSGGNLETCYSETGDDRVSLDIINDTGLTFLSQRSSVESLSIAGDIFQLGTNNHKNGDLQRSTSLESWAIPYKVTEELLSLQGSGDISMGSDAVGELSKRTLDLLKRLENIQNPVSPKMKRSVSDITLQSNSLKMSFTGQLSFDAASSANEDSAASLTELSSSDELSLCSEDIIVHKNKISDSNASFKKHVNHSVTDEADVNISMIVNVSCTSACTDEEDDSDLLSSSTLTLTEEELCIKDDDDSSIATDDEINEESNHILDKDNMKNEFHHWIKPIFSLTKEKKKLNPGEKDRCRTDSSSTRLPIFKNISTLYPFLNSSVLMQSESKDCKGTLLRPKERHFKQNGMETLRHFCTDHLRDDVENGNVEKSLLKDKKELTRVLDSKKLQSFEKEQITGKTHETECSKSELFSSRVEQKTDVVSAQYIPAPQSPTQSPQKDKRLVCLEDNGIANKLLSSSAFNVDKEPIFSEKFAKYHDVTTLGGKTSPASENERPRHHQDSNAELPFNCHDDEYNITSKESAVKCSSHFNSENKQLEETNQDYTNGMSSCICHSSVPHGVEGEEDSSVHNFVMEIIDMASTALKNISQHDSEMVSPTSVAQIKEKVLEHSHRPLQLRKGDFYSYLSISSHDSDCGEVTTCIDEKSSTPLPLDFNDEARLDNNGEDDNFLNEDFEEQYTDQLCLFDSTCQRDRVSDNNLYPLTKPVSFSDSKESPLPNDRLDIVASKAIHVTPSDQNTCGGNLIETNKITDDPDTFLGITNQICNTSEDSTFQSVECHIENPYLNSLMPKAQTDTSECLSDNESFFAMSKIEMLEPNAPPLNKESDENHKSVKQSHEIKVNLVKDTQPNNSHFEKPGDNLFLSTKIQFPQHGHPENDQAADCKVKEKHYKKENHCDGNFNSSQKEIPSSQKYVTGNLRKTQKCRTTDAKPTACVSHHSELPHDSHAARSVPKRSVAAKQDQRQRNLAVSLLHFCPPIPKVASNLIEPSSSSLILKTSSFQTRVFHAGVVIWLLLLILCMAVAVTPLLVIPTDCSKIRHFSSSWTPVLSYLQGPPPF
ncbi:A-kinase anchor protein 6 [Heptranchias perlo]|uniref:A-kinase anchor protein 6 n=1 Tax=Heptranchias perlo TaxID=212740 RepID=UPI00355A23E1